jgi:hypothetical protein
MSCQWMRQEGEDWACVYRVFVCLVLFYNRIDYYIVRVYVLSCFGCADCPWRFQYVDRWVLRVVWVWIVNVRFQNKKRNLFVINEHYILLSEEIFKVKVNVLMFYLTVFVYMLIHDDGLTPGNVFIFRMQWIQIIKFGVCPCITNAVYLIIMFRNKSRIFYFLWIADRILWFTLKM